MHLRSVLFPDPERPKITTTSPSAISRSTPFRTSFSPNTLRRPRSLTIARAAHPVEHGVVREPPQGSEQRERDGEQDAEDGDQDGKRHSAEDEQQPLQHERRVELKGREDNREHDEDESQYHGQLGAEREAYRPRLQGLPYIGEVDIVASEDDQEPCFLVRSVPNHFLESSVRVPSSCILFMIVLTSSMSGCGSAGASLSTAAAGDS